MTSEETFLLGFVGGIQIYNDRTLADRTRFTKNNYDLPSDLGYGYISGRFVEVGGKASDEDYSIADSMWVWGVKEIKDNINLSDN